MISGGNPSWHPRDNSTSTAPPRKLTAAAIRKAYAAARNRWKVYVQGGKEGK